MSLAKWQKTRSVKENYSYFCALTIMVGNKSFQKETASFQIALKMKYLALNFTWYKMSQMEEIKEDLNRWYCALGFEDSVLIRYHFFPN